MRITRFFVSTWRIYDETGKLIKSGEVEKQASLSLDLTEQAAGIYYLNCYPTDERPYTEVISIIKN